MQASDTTRLSNSGTTDGSTDDHQALYDVLANTRRRHVIRALADDPPCDLGELAEYIAAIENDKPAQQLRSQERKRVYVSLYQSHLQSLADADVIRNDDQEIRPGPTHGICYEAIQRCEYAFSGEQTDTEADESQDDAQSLLERVRTYLGVSA
ncbi:hypothetical protein Hbl1158_10285 [Halobaculum sp. CBA1158]|uniref:DUF7344 domain-containing protein n=1 Tax=Halobaculum sp. CBA1158 TaxID=2904243 RepID=UPI001F45ED8C|nr:hypothetical protein [Halobaculum sp. CBA1158]UIO98922.1 hypothetical protein Hbl1158_10285 [Halobaculum sp. CBA1158]